MAFPDPFRRQPPGMPEFGPGPGQRGFLPPPNFNAAAAMQQQGQGGFPVAVPVAPPPGLWPPPSTPGWDISIKSLKSTRRYLRQQARFRRWGPEGLPTFPATPTGLTPAETVMRHASFRQHPGPPPGPIPGCWTGIPGPPPFPRPPGAHPPAPPETSSPSSTGPWTSCDSKGGKRKRTSLQATDHAPPTSSKPAISPDLNTNSLTCFACKHPLNSNSTYTCANAVPQRSARESETPTSSDTDQQALLTDFYRPVGRELWFELLLDWLFSEEVRDFSLTDDEKKAELTAVLISMLP